MSLSVGLTASFLHSIIISIGNHQKLVHIQEVINSENLSYKTIVKSSEGLYKEKGSKFIALSFHAESEEQCKLILQDVKKEYYDARHHCYAYRVNPEDEKYRSNDDGEPSGSAGKPILNQLYSLELFNVIVIVVRYFGGTKLGVSGLINAYKSSAREALESTKIITRHLTREFELVFEYPLMNDIMRVIKEENLKILDQDFAISCVIKIVVKKNAKELVLIKLRKIRGLKIKSLKSS